MDEWLSSRVCYRSIAAYTYILNLVCTVCSGECVLVKKRISFFLVYSLNLLRLLNTFARLACTCYLLYLM
jgi:hypothetical protein